VRIESTGKQRFGQIGSTTRVQIDSTLVLWIFMFCSCCSGNCRPPSRDQSSGNPTLRNSGSVVRSSALITWPIRGRSTSQRRELGSHMAPARLRIWTKSAGQRKATIPPSIPNSPGPIREGRGAGNCMADSRFVSRRLARAESAWRRLNEWLDETGSIGVPDVADLLVDLPEPQHVLCSWPQHLRGIAIARGDGSEGLPPRTTGSPSTRATANGVLPSGSSCHS
jgi:hypothetical protein